MSGNELGSGLSLDNKWDLYVDESNGDIAFDRAGEEVRKDLAFNVALGLRGSIGGVPTQGVLRDLESIVGRIILEDSRIDSIENIEASFISTEQEVEIEVLAVTVEDTTIEQVFTEPVQ